MKAVQLSTIAAAVEALISPKRQASELTELQADRQCAVPEARARTVAVAFRLRNILAASLAARLGTTDALFVVYLSSPLPGVARTARPFGACRGRKSFPSTFRNFAYCEAESWASCFSTSHVTFSEHGGVVSDPEYV
jgi:hypothetical protein